MAIAIYIAVSSILAFCLNQDAQYYLSKPKAPVVTTLPKGKV
jgi:hypothetical protein